MAARPIKKPNRAWLAAAVVLTFFVMFPNQCVAGDLKLTLVIYDHAHMSAETLAETENTASAIFGRAGVRLIWVEGFAHAAGRHDVLTPPREDPATLIVKLQPESHAARYGVPSVCGGIGLESGAIVFVRRFDAIWLAHIIAHELGHVLLGRNAHSVSGIMRATLRNEDWEKAAQGTLGFTRGQNQQIRTWIDERRLR